MSTEPEPIDAAELAWRAANRPGAWFVLLVSAASTASRAVAELIAELELLGDDPPVAIERPGSPTELAELLTTSSPTGELVLSGVDDFSDDDWQHVDLLRSRLRRQPAVIVVATSRAIERLMERAPHLASWVVGAWRWNEHADELSADEREQRLVALRAWAGLSDQELVQRAERGELPPEPEYAEWLVLLGREELIGRG